MNKMRGLGMLCLVTTCLTGGCGFFSGPVKDAGLRYEKPVTVQAGHGPVLHAYTDPDRRRLAVQYRVAVEGRSEARWIHLTYEQISQALGGAADQEIVTLERRANHNKLTLRRSLVAKLVRTKPEWEVKTMQPVALYRLSDEYEAREGAFLAVRPASDPRQNARALFVMDIPDTKGWDLVEFGFPSRNYRTAAGDAVQALYPGAVALDVVTSPAQFVGLLLLE